MIQFILEGNHKNPNGNPLGYHRTTTRQKWNPQYQDYIAYKSWVVKEFWNQVKLPLEPNWKVDKLALEPFVEKVRGKVKLNIQFSSEIHADSDNVVKGILDSLFKQDKEIDVCTTHTCGNKQARVLIQIYDNNELA